MNFNITTLLNLFIFSSLSILFILFTYNIIRKKKSAPYLITLLAFGLLGGFFAFLDSSEILPSFGSYSRIYLIIELSFYGLQFFFFFLFLEDLSSLKPHIGRIIIMFGFLLLQQFSIWLIVWFEPISSEIGANLWLLADIGYNNLALISFGILGIYVYYKLYDYTKEIKALILILALILISLGYIVHSLVDYIGFFSTLPELLDSISILGDIFPLLGIIFFIILYVIDVDYIYRLPSDHYLLMTTYKSGVPIHYIEFKTKKKIKIEENLFSGFLTSISMVFDKILHTPAPIESISSKESTILMRSGEYIVVTMITENPTSILTRALDSYIFEFEKKYSKYLKDEETDITIFENADSLINPIFPFFEIKNS